MYPKVIFKTNFANVGGVYSFFLLQIQFLEPFFMRTTLRTN